MSTIAAHYRLQRFLQLLWLTLRSINFAIRYVEIFECVLLEELREVQSTCANPGAAETLLLQPPKAKVDPLCGLQILAEWLSRPAIPLPGAKWR